MKIKFRALCLAALVVVMAFASVASAATFIGVNKAGTVQTFTVDISDGGTPLSRKAAVGGSGPSLAASADRHNVLKMFSIPGTVYAVSTDTAQGAGTNQNMYVYNVASDGTPTYAKTLEAQTIASGNAGGAGGTWGHNVNGVKKVVDFKGTPIFVGESAFTALLNNTNIISFDVSVDLAFVYNDKLYIINSRDASYIQEVSAITASTVSRDIADIATNTPNPGKSGVLSYRVKGDQIAWPTTAGSVNHGAFCSVVTEKYVYMSSGTGVYKIDLSETDVLHSPTVQKTVLQGEFLAMTANGETIYAVKRMGGSYYLVSVSTGTDEEKELNRMSTGWSDLSNQSMDIYYNPSDGIIGVVAHGAPFTTASGLAVYTPNSSIADKWDLYTVDGEFQTAAMVFAASETTPDTPDTPVTTTTVDINTLDSGVASAIASAMGTDASKFVTATVASKTSTTSAAEAAVKTAFGDTNAKVTVLGSYTPSAEGFILVAQSIAHGKKAYFVDESILAADSTGLNEATLLDSKGAVLTSGNSTYVAGGSLDANKAYTLVTAETASSEKEDDGDTGSSSSGCDAGFGLMSLAALLAVTTISKRR